MKDDDKMGEKGWAVKHAIKYAAKHAVNPIPSPCVRNCCLDQQDICMGCFRHLDEIVGWQERSNEEKLAIQARCQQRRVASK